MCAPGLDAAEFPSQSPYKLGEHSAHLTDENTLLRCISSVSGPGTLLCVPHTVPLHKEFHHPNLRPQRSAAGSFISAKSPPFTPICQVLLFSLLGVFICPLPFVPSHCWFRLRATVLSHLRSHFFYHLPCHTFPCFPTVLLLGLPSSPHCLFPGLSMNPPATQRTALAPALDPQPLGLTCHLLDVSASSSLTPRGWLRSPVILITLFCGPCV